MRGHRDGNHSGCDPAGGYCREARELEYRNEEHLLAVALFAALETRGIDAEEWFGDGFAVARDLAAAELPDYDYLPREPDSVLMLRAAGFMRAAVFTQP